MPANLSICHGCSNRQRPCGADGSCACEADDLRRDIIVIAELGDCPLGLHGGPAAASPPPPITPPPPLAREAWPLPARLLARLAIESDMGLGDVVQRMAARAGGEWYKQILAAIKINCGCEANQAALNARYPLR